MFYINMAFFLYFKVISQTIFTCLTIMVNFNIFRRLLSSSFSNFFRLINLLLLLILTGNRGIILLINFRLVAIIIHVLIRKFGLLL